MICPKHAGTVLCADVSRRGRFCLTLVPSPKGNVVNFEHNPNRSRAKGIPKPSPDGEGYWGRKPPSRSPEVGWSFSGAELPGIHPWGLVLGAHAALGDQQDRSSQNQDGAADVQDGGANAAGGAQDK